MNDTRARKAARSYVPTGSDWLLNEPAEEEEYRDPEDIAKEMTDPLIESMRRDLAKIDVTPFKK